MENLVYLQKNYFNKLNNPLKLDINYRIKLLKNLKYTISKYEKEIEICIKEDLAREEKNTYFIETAPLLLELNYIIKNLKKWAKVKNESTPLAFLGYESKIQYSPYGVTLIISPWNYPFLLALSPLIGAISAGNCVILKPSEYCPKTSSLIKKIINEVFPKEIAEVVLGDYHKVNELIDLKMDYIFFTGSTSVGEIIMEKAAKNLTPISLELGGKSPCIFEKTANLNLGIKRLIWGKTTNAGQTCIAPDYVLIEENLLENFLKIFKKSIKDMFTEEPIKCENYQPIINNKNFERILKYLENQNIIFGGKYDKSRLKIEPTLILNPSLNSPVMKDELFCPILPIITYKNKNEIYEIIQKNPNPLSIYIFSKNKNFQNEIIKNIAFGGCTINSTLFHTANFYMPFGGIGKSGIGNYHGKYSFETFSHKKSIFKATDIIDNPIKYPPYKHFEIIQKILKMFLK